ncbi:MAG: hypothetical protein DYG98_13370 [Haliscomenobacteraceae bacterium CHB4]|nr:hypothetical protein [Saprospiraceae bacterium]MCE7924042.1 hypothetical protein [Haliscomenobacteraceae bacterium CHB4]
MAKHLLFGLLLLAATLQAQQDSLPKPLQTSISQRIASARQELLASFLNDDPAAASLWRDSLMRLEDSTHVALVWDERWLLYYWEEAYGNLFDEAIRLDAAERQHLANKQPPPKDSLFEKIDQRLYELRFQIYEKISRGFLTEEEKQFALIELDYLLRLNQAEIASGDWNKRLDAFLQIHPESRFKPYIQANLYAPAEKMLAQNVKTDRGFSLDFLFSSGQWRNELEQTLRSPYGFDIGLSYWLRHWNFGLRCNFSWQKLNRSVIQNGYEWPKNDPSVLIAPALEVGYDILNNKKVKVFPSFVAGISILKPPGVDEEEEEPLPDYYSDFFFAKGFLGAALTADVKLKTFNSSDEEYPDVSFIGARIRLGYNWLNWGDDNPDLRGDLFYFAIGINLFGHSIE